MKKRLLLILMVLVLAATIPLTGCENTFKRARLSEKQDTSYTVIGNGGNAVSYGNFIYFINGYRGYEDTDGNSNVWGNVTKGALYRVKLLGENDSNGEFVKSVDPDSGLEFASSPYIIDKNEYHQFLSPEDYETIKTGAFTIETDLNIDRIDEDDYEANYETETFYIDDVRYHVDNVELVASKVIGTASYADGGIFIYDEFVYYASPNNQRDKSGNVQTSKTDFFRTDINGTKTERIYTTSTDNSSSAAFGFYKQGSYTYLVVLDGSDIVSIKMNSKKVVARNILADNATSAYFPVKSVYDAANNATDGVEDFVYYTRATEKEDGAIRTGNVIEVVRPNGKNRFELVKNGTDSTIESVKDGLVFYRTTDSQNRQVLRFTNMHEALLEYNEGNSAYTALVAGIALDEIPSDYTSIYCFRPNATIDSLNDNVYVLGFTSSGVFIEDNSSLPIRILNEQAVSPAINGNTLYYANSSGAYHYVNIFTPHQDNTPQLIEEQGASGAIIRNSFVAGYFVFMGTVDVYANAYAKFYPLGGDDTTKSIFIGERTEEDTKLPPQDK